MKYSIATFTPTDASDSPIVVDDKRLTIPLDMDEWVMTAGLDPDVNSAIVTLQYLDRLSHVPNVETLRKYLRSDRGWIELWADVDPIAIIDAAGELPEPAVRIKRVYLADTKRLESSIRPNADWPEKYEGTRFQVYFADVRWRWRPPFAGVLRHGEINAAPLGSDGNDANDRPIVETGDLIRKCLDAMGVSYGTSVIQGMDEAKLPRIENLNWKCSSATGELKKLLDAIGAIAAPTMAGGLELYAQGQGEGITYDWDETTVTPAMHTGSEVVVVTSAPSAILETKTVIGIGANGWEYCYWSPHLGKWTATVEVDDFGAHPSFEEAIRGDFIGTDPDRRIMLHSTVGYCIRLNLPKSAILRPGRDLGESQPFITAVDVRAKVMMQDAAGVWSNAADYVHIPLERIDDRGRVLVCGYQLTKLDTGGVNPIADARLLTGEDLKVRMTREMLDETGNVKFFEVGFKLDPGGELVQLTEQELETAVASPDTRIVSEPSLVLRVIDDLLSGLPVEIGKADLVERAREIAQGFLPYGDSTGVAMNHGFLPVQLTGRWSEVRWSLGKFSTTAMLDAYRRPLYYNQVARNSKRYGNVGAYYSEVESYPLQARTAGEKLQTNQSGYTQPVQVIGGRAPARQQVSSRIVTLSCTNPTTGDGDAATSTPCSYVYTVTDAITGVELGTGVVPEGNRWCTDGVVPATRGEVYWASGAMKLVAFDELPTPGCAVTPEA